jgi:ribose 5-phosphate isomerase B
MRLFIGSDHAGFNLKKDIKLHFPYLHMIDIGTDTDTISSDYPDIAHKMASRMTEPTDFGVLICGSGIGISMAANRHSHIRCALCTTTRMAELSRQHNNANVLALGARTTSDIDVYNILVTFLGTIFEGGRHQKRIDKITPIMSLELSLEPSLEPSS